MPPKVSVIQLAKATLQSVKHLQQHTISTTTLESCPSSIPLAAGAASTCDLFRQLAAALASTNPSAPAPRVLGKTKNTSTNTATTEARKEKLAAILQMAGEATPTSPQAPPATSTSNSTSEPFQSTINATYGTTPPATIHEVLDSIYGTTISSENPVSGGLFVDAGSGMGLPTLAAALSNRFKIARGVEFDAKWHSQAVLLKDAYDEHTAMATTSTKANTRMETAATDSTKDAPLLEYFCNDVTNSDAGYFVGATCIFMNSVTYDATLCRNISMRIETDTQHTGTHTSNPPGKMYNEQEDDVFVVSMSRTLALPSFDLIDILRMKANGGGDFNFYVSRRSKNQPLEEDANNSVISSRHSSFFAMSDSETMRELRETSKGSILKELIQLASNLSLTTEAGVWSAGGLQFLAAVGASEPSVRTMALDDGLWKSLIISIGTKADLATRALGSMVFRAIVDHPVGRRAVTDRSQVVDALVAAIGRSDEHPIIKANLLDVLGNILCDSPLEHASSDIDEMLKNVKEDAECEGQSDVIQAFEETLAIRRWWNGEQRSLPDALIS